MKKRRPRIQLNIGTAIFGVIFIYLIITLIMYASKANIETYQVVEGSLSANEVFNALILRNETVVSSTSNGYVNYYVEDGSKVAKSDLICSVTTEQQPQTSVELSESDLEDLRALAAKAAGSFDSTDYQELYDLKYSITNIMWDTSAIASSSGNFYTSSEDGIVSMIIDGYEDIVESELTSDLGRDSVYSAARYRSQDSVQAGEDLYKIISGEEWYIIFTLTDEQLVRLDELSNVEVKFITDNCTEVGEFTFFENDGQKFGKVTFESGLIRYVDDRFVDIEIANSSVSGLKIPVSAIVSKDFYTIPESFLTYGGDDLSEVGFTRQITNEDGSTETEFVSATLYYKSEPEDEDDEALYYIDTDVFEEGDILVGENAGNKFTVGQTDALKGVYSINRGYTVFRQIVILDQNTEYCIVETGTTYGLSLYDFIVADGSTVEENQVVA